MRLAILLFCLSLGACAQSPPATRTVTLTWEDPSNPTGTTYTVYKTNNPAAPTSAFVVVARNITVKTFVETGVVPGLYRYYVTSVLGGAESLPSNIASADAKPFAPLSFRAVADAEVP